MCDCKFGNSRGSSHKSPAECINVLSTVGNSFMTVPLTVYFYPFFRWRLIFSWRIWNWLSPYWNKCFFTMILVLIVLFLGKQSAVSQRQSAVTDNMLSVQPSFKVSVLPQMLFVRCRSTRVLSPCKMSRWTPICMTTSTWSCSEPRGTSTYLASLSSSGCKWNLFPHSQIKENYFIIAHNRPLAYSTITIHKSWGLVLFYPAFTLLVLVFSCLVNLSQCHASDHHLAKPGCCHLGGQRRPSGAGGLCRQSSQAAPGGQPNASTSEPVFLLS